MAREGLAPLALIGKTGLFRYMLFGLADMRYTLRQLEVFLAVAAHRERQPRGARSSAMSQSAVSGSLADLERQFDVQLFDRVGKRLQLSELGRALRPARRGAARAGARARARARRARTRHRPRCASAPR